MTRDWWDENGVYHGDKPQDIRNLKSLKTDSDGEIAILKRGSAPVNRHAGKPEGVTP